MQTTQYLKIVIATGFMLFSSCRNSVKEAAEMNSGRTPVEIESLRQVTMDETSNLPAIAAYLKKETLRATATGYITRIYKKLGESVSAGDLILQIKTKEAYAVKELPSDSALRISGLISMRANSNGMVSQVDHQAGDFVSEADPLVTLAQPGSLVFYLKLPYSERAFVHTGQLFPILLPDGKILKGKITGMLSSVDPGSQSVDFILDPINPGFIPENLWAEVPVNRMRHQGNFSLPRPCVQSNETQTEFWVMKLINDSTSIKVDISKGIESDSLVEILSARFDSRDRFISKGSYGLPDTAQIVIER